MQGRTRLRATSMTPHHAAAQKSALDQLVAVKQCLAGRSAHEAAADWAPVLRELERAFSPSDITPPTSPNSTMRARSHTDGGRSSTGLLADDHASSCAHRRCRSAYHEASVLCAAQDPVGPIWPHVLSQIGGT